MSDPELPSVAVPVDDRPSTDAALPVNVVAACAELMTDCSAPDAVSPPLLSRPTALCAPPLNVMAVCRGPPASSPAELSPTACWACTVHARSEVTSAMLLAIRAVLVDTLEVRLV